ncbi:MAG: cupin domain-containing protein [Armatimonadota bacterium]|nr:MAG: cupin domain-containing protein [Armatimonadota bacterium]
MKRYRLSELPACAGRHVFSGIVEGAYIWQEAAVEFRGPGEKVPWGVHDDEEIYVILQGKAHVQLDSGVEHLSAGDVMMIAPGECHEFVSDEDEPCVQMYLHCGPEPHPRQAA